MICNVFSGNCVLLNESCFLMAIKTVVEGISVYSYTVVGDYVQMEIIFDSY